MSDNLATLPQVVVGTTPLQITPIAFQSQTFHKRSSASVFAAAANTGTIFVGDSFVSTTRYAAALTAGQLWTIAGSAIDLNKIYVLGSIANQIAQPSST